MKVIKKINNNVAECIDGNGNHLIAFGNGIGFPKTPYELTDLKNITMTFYKLDNHHEKLISELPEELLEISMDIVSDAQKKLRGQLNPTLVFSLADHIQFALQRLSEYQEIKLFFSNELEKLYPVESELAEAAVALINKRLNVELPKSEVHSIAMHFVNSQSEYKISQEEILIENVIEQITQLIERELNIDIDRDEFNYSRFQMHVRYYLKRIRTGEQFLDENKTLIQSLQNTKPEIYQVSQKVGSLLYEYLAVETVADELLYLMIHINRLYEKSIS